MREFVLLAVELGSLASDDVAFPRQAVLNGSLLPTSIERLLAISERKGEDEIKVPAEKLSQLDDLLLRALRRVKWSRRRRVRKGGRIR